MNEKPQKFSSSFQNPASAARPRGMALYKLLWLLLFLSGLLFRVRGTEQVLNNPFDFWAVFRMSVICAIGLVMLVNGRALSRISLIGRGPMFCISAYAGLAIISTAWSVMPAWTLYKSGEYLIDVLLVSIMVASFSSSAEFKELFDWTWVLLGGLLASVWIGAMVSPAALIGSKGILGFQVQGLFPYITSNSVGEVGAFLSVMACARLLGGSRRRAFYAAILAVALGTLIISQCRSALLGFLLAAGLMLYLTKRIGLFSLVMGVCALMFLAGGETDELATDFLRRGQDEEAIYNLSGRTLVWNYAWNFYLQKPILGYGAYAGGKFLVLAEFGKGGIDSLLSTWVETLIGIGPLGVLLLLIGVGWSAWIFNSHAKLFAAQDPVAFVLILEAMGIVALLAMRSIFSMAYIWHGHALPAFLLAVSYAGYLRRQSRIALFG